MLNLYSLVARKQNQNTLSDNEIAAVYYHDIFDYPLNLPELIKWVPANPDFVVSDLNVVSKNGYYFLEGREGLVYKRTLRKRISEKKFEIAKKASKVLGIIPGVSMIGVTGSLAMNNSNEDGDIDLLVVTKRRNLWTTRLLVYVTAKLFGLKTRKQGDKNQKDKLCLNIWMDEGDLKWKKKDRNIYTAHEIGQIMPLVNKDKTYEKFIWENSWIKDFWPNAISPKVPETRKGITKNPAGVIEKISYWVQRTYMKGKITRETVSPTRAIFHPHDWGSIVLSRLSP